MMRASLLISMLLVGVFTFSKNAEAARRDFGLGIVLVNPTGLTAEYIHDRGQSFVASVGWGEDYLHLNLDHHWNKKNLVKVDNVPIGFYYGFGMRWIQNGDDNSIGARFPLGVQHIFREVPIQVFIELAPVLVLVDHTGFGIDLALGARYFF